MMEPLRNRNAEPLCGKDIFVIGSITIIPHALDAFCQWTLADFPTAPDAIRDRLGNATLIRSYPKEYAEWHFQDVQDPDLSYWVKTRRNKRKQKVYYLASVVKKGGAKIR